MQSFLPNRQMITVGMRKPFPQMAPVFQEQQLEQMIAGKAVLDVSQEEIILTYGIHLHRQARRLNLLSLRPPHGLVM